MLELLYAAALLVLAVYGLNSLLLTAVYWLRAGPAHQTQVSKGPPATFPMVTVQLPIFNERYVVERLLGAVGGLDYPRERLQIQVVDDSTDETRDIVDRVAARMRARGTDIQVRRRPRAAGYKGGALAEAMPTARGEFLAIFDADFLPPADFLTRTLPSFSDPTVGCVQTRWEHVNAGYSLFTKVQAAGIDGHFIVEQEARNRMGWFIGFNGSAGIWRRSCIESAGGWSGDTLTEDLDLSYRAQLAGWRFAFRTDVTVPGEVPAQMDAYKRQQFRWAKGSVQCAMKLLPALWRARLPLLTKVQGTLHLGGYLMHPLMLLVFLLGVPMAVAHSPVFALLPYLAVAMIGPWCLYGTALAQRSRSLGDWLTTMLMLNLLGAGMSINNTRAALEALLGVNSVFRRTPKFDLRSRADQWRAKKYALPNDPFVWAELAAAALAIAALLPSIWGQSVRVNQWLLIYGCGYGYVAMLSLWQGYGREAVRRANVRRAERREVTISD
jgi:cellulose synthase/poly-beta-1,6-N-acetylglucosamine synthase-like glycosyltransferase